jgi:cytochrome c peroxidase
MKTTPLFSSARNLLVVALVLAGSFRGPASGASSQLAVSPGASANVVRLTVNDPSNRVWVLQGSANCSSWTNLESLKLHNGAFTRARTNSPATTHQFFRAVCDTNWQNIPSTTNNALIWPASAYNFAAPVLPASFSVQPIVGQDTTPGNNLTTDVGAALARILFYDKRLSANQTVSCAACHRVSSSPRASCRADATFCRRRRNVG